MNYDKTKYLPVKSNLFQTEFPVILVISYIFMTISKILTFEI